MNIKIKHRIKIDRIWRIFVLFSLITINVIPAGTQPVLAQSANPTFGVRANDDRIEGWEWPVDATVIIEIAGFTPSEPIIATVGVADWDSNQTYFSLNIENYDLKTGDFVTVTDGNTTKELTITPFEITGYDLDKEMVYGEAGDGQYVNVWTCWQDEPCVGRDETANASGNWVTNFSIAGEQDWEQETADLRPGSWIDSSVSDEDGDQIMFGVSVPNPYIEAAPYSDWIHAREWPLDTVITMEIDDPADGIGENDSDPVDYSATATMAQAPWNPSDPNDIVAEFDWPDQFVPGSGYVITMSGNGQSKTLTVSQLKMTGSDQSADTISGIASPGAQIQVCANVPDNCITRWVTAADGSGAWTADYGIPGTGNDSPETFDVQPGSNGWAAEYEDDSDRTWFDWNVADPRIEVSYEHDWIQIRDFTPGGDVTYTIFDYEDGHALFGPVTGPVDSHGNGWISSNLHHTDLIPGNYITAVNEATGEEVSILIRDLNLDYVDVVNDRAYGTAVPNSTIELHIDENYNQGFSLTVDVDGSGYWEVDLAAAGHPIDEYRRASINLYDDEGDNIVAQPPRVHAEIRSDNMGVDNFSKNSDVTLTLYESPGGTVLYGPTTLRTDGSGNAWVNLYQLGIDLVPGNYIVAYDHYLDFTKDLEVEPFTIDGMNTGEDVVYGTSADGEWVEIHVESLFSNWGLDALTGEDLNWTRDYGAEDYDITDQMWANGWATDDQDNWSEDHTTGLPGLEASIAGDWISGFNFSPDRPVQISIYDAEGGLIKSFQVTAGGDTQFNANYGDHEVDLQAGMYILAEDLETGKSASLTLVPLTFDGVNYDTNTAWGTADDGTQVVVRANHLFDSYEMTVTADTDGWFADFSSLADITPEWGLRAMVFDLEFDATVADAPQPPQFTASLTSDWINGNNWTPNNSVTVSLGGSAIGDWDTDNYGNFYADLRNEGIDLLPDNYITVTDYFSTVVKSLTLPNLTIDDLDPDLEIARGQAPADTRLSIDFNNQQENIQFDLFSESDDTWTADFAAHDFDLQPGSSGTVIIFDDDGDGTQVEGYVPNPHFTVYPEWEAVEAYDWPDGATVSASVSGKDVCTAEGSSGYPEWDPSTTNVWMNFSEDCDVVAGDIVTVTSGENQISHVVQNLKVTEANAEFDYVSGNANFGTKVYVWPHGYGEYEVQPIANSEDIWQANFDFDLHPGTDGRSEVRDENGNATAVDWHVPNPMFAVRVNANWVEANEWDLGTSLTLKIDDPDNGPGVDYSDTQTVEEAPWDPSQTYAEIQFEGVYDVQPGDVVTLTDGTTTKTHVVTMIEITGYDLENDLVFGVADPLTDNLLIYACDNENCFGRHVNSGSSGEWTADFGNPGTLDDEQNTYDIVGGTWLDAQQGDEDGDFTFNGLGIPNPNIRAITNEDRVDGWQWSAGATVTLTIDDPDTLLYPDFSTQGQVGFDDGSGQTYVDIGFKGDYDLKPGDIVKLTDGTDTKSVTATNVTVSNVDVSTNIVTGTAEPGSRVWSAACQYGDCFQRTTTADLEGNWSIDFDEDMPGQLNVDILPGGSVDGEQFDDDGDSTLFTWGIPNPTFGVRVNYDGIEGWEWPLGATVTIEIAGFTPSEPITATVGVAGWDPNQTYFSLNIENYDLKEGDVVSVTDGNTIKELTVTHFEITGYDLDTDMVYGEAGENQYVNVWTCWQDDPCIGRDETADENGEWSTNFAVPGEQDWEEETADLRPGSWIDSSVSDEDGDQVLFGINVPFNQSPTNIIISAPTDPVQVGIPVAVSATFEDPDEGDTHTATWDWGDDSSSSGTVTDHSVYGEHVYSQPGVYILTLTVADRAGAEATATYQYIVAYDPDGGFVTGGGWFDTTDGKANFGFNAKYHPDAKVPYGNTQFQVGQMKFKADSYNWLVVSAARAQYQGVGTINNTGEYGFFITLIDGKLSGGDDLFRIKIWDLATGEVVYDTQPGDPNYADPVTALGGGSIVVHKAK